MVLSLRVDVLNKLVFFFSDDVVVTYVPALIRRIGVLDLSSLGLPEKPLRVSSRNSSFKQRWAQARPSALPLVTG